MQDVGKNDIETKSLSEQEFNWLSLSIHTYIKAAIIAVAVYFLFKTQIYSIVQRWINDSSWSHGFIIPLFSLYFINQKKKEILTTEFRPNYLGLVCLVMCLAAYPMFLFVYRFGYFMNLMIVPTIGAIVLFLGGWKLVKYTWLPITYLFFAIPLPAKLYNDITIPLRSHDAQIAAALLNMVKGLEANASGVVIDIVYNGVKLEPGLDVAEACSGMRLLMAFVALGVAMAYLHYRPAWQRFILLASTVPIAILCNIVRVVVTAFIYVLWDPIYAQGIYHDALGILMLPLAFGLYGFLAWFMSNVFVEETVQKEVVIRRKDSQ
ncbi:MAG: exosortase/archaeosortase family protein [Planctomycetaceae bacterium]|nr:exosortase/archaeosortase family protein [Planctomycetaceae bacterium]